MPQENNFLSNQRYYAQRDNHQLDHYYPLDHKNSDFHFQKHHYLYLKCQSRNTLFDKRTLRLQLFKINFLLIEYSYLSILTGCGLSIIFIIAR